MSLAANLALSDADRSDIDWLAVAEQLATRLHETAATRERAALPPHEEVAWLREAGLLTLLNPRQAGGGGGTFSDAFRVVRLIARGDTSIAQLLSYHYLLSHSAFWRAEAAQRNQLIGKSVAEEWFWGGASNPRDDLTVLAAEGGGFRLNGRKTFASNASLANRITLRAALGDAVVLIALPGTRDGITHGNDWDAFGQRLSESGSVSFQNVRVEREDILGPLPSDGNAAVHPLATLVVPIHQLLFVNFYLGTAEGALATAKLYVHEQARPWQTSGVTRASEDPYILELYGTLYSDLRASVALAEQAAVDIEDAIAQDTSLTAERRTAAAASVYAAKVNSTRVALDVTTRIFDLMGARATAAQYGFDRFWRNVRTHTLHDPLAYKAREVGNFQLNGLITADPLYT